MFRVAKGKKRNTYKIQQRFLIVFWVDYTYDVFTSYYEAAVAAAKLNGK